VHSLIAAKIAPSLACADFWQLSKEITELEEGGADFFHIDIMDGHFVHNFSLGTDVLNSIRKHISIPIEVHLQICDPARFVKLFADLNVDILTFHVEACDRLHQMVKIIRDAGMKMGVAINPCTPISVLETILPRLDMVNVMTVEPGFASQDFIDGVLHKIKVLRRISKLKKLDLDIAVDGNINNVTIPMAAAAGANVFILGTSSIFTSQKDLKDLTQRFKELSCEKVREYNKEAN